MCCHTHTCTHRQGPRMTACAVTHIGTHRQGPGGTAYVAHTCVHTAKDLVGPLMLSYPHMYTQVKTGRDHLCCHTQTCTHGGGCRVLSHTVLCVMKHFTLT